MDYPVTRQASLYEYLNNSSIIRQKDFCGPKPACVVNDFSVIYDLGSTNFTVEQILNI